MPWTAVGPSRVRCGLPTMLMHMHECCEMTGYAIEKTPTNDSLAVVGQRQENVERVMMKLLLVQVVGGTLHATILSFSNQQ